QCGWLNTRAAELLAERNPAALRRLAPRTDASGACCGLDHFHSFSPLDFFSREEMDPVFQTIVPTDGAHPRVGAHQGRRFPYVGRRVFPFDVDAVFGFGA
ncbi:MAG: hypothetical protein QHJ73_11120, partial [Armatimonadota bacterium]|nr:hypothetical protein [Armatimonadota bacterium]